MAGKKNPTLDPLKVAMILMGVRSFDPLVRRLGPDHPNVKKKVNAYFENIERQYDQTTLAWARLKQDTWRPIDVERLLRLRTLSPIQRDELERLLSDLQADPRRARGRSVLDPPKPFAEAFADAWTLGIRLANPAMPAHERRQLYLETPWYGRYIAAAYRGELRSALRRRVDKTLPHEIASDLAEQAVAAAAQISDRQVKKLYFEDGDKFSRIKPSEEETSAAKLKRHLEKGHPDLPPI